MQNISFQYLNHPNTTCGPTDLKNFCITDLSSYVERPDITDVPPDYQFVLGFNNYLQQVGDTFGADKYGHFMSKLRANKNLNDLRDLFHVLIALRDDIVLVGAINNISFTFPSFSLLTQPGDVNENLFCDEMNRPQRCNNMQICPCIHRLKVPMNSIVELVVVDETLSKINRKEERPFR